MKLKRDYNRKRFSNPFFPKKQKKIFLSRRNKIALLFLIIALGAWTYFIFCSSFFKIKKVEIERARQGDSNYFKLSVAADDILNIVQNQINAKTFFFKNSNIFIFSPEKAKAKINEQFLLENLAIKKIVPDTIKIIYQEKTAEAIFAANNRYFYIDWDGLALENLSPAAASSTDSSIEILKQVAENTGLTLVWDLGLKNDIELKENVIQKSTISSILEIRDSLKEKIANQALIFKFNSKINDRIDVLTEKGYWIYFSPENDIKKQIETFAAVLKEQIGDKKIEYIDLRFGNRVFYK